MIPMPIALALLVIGLLLVCGLMVIRGNDDGS